MDIEEDSDANEFFQKNQPPNVSDPMFQKAPAMFNRPPPKIFGQNAMPSTTSNDYKDNDSKDDRGK